MYHSLELYISQVLQVKGWICFHTFSKQLRTVWPENLTGIKFDEIASKLHNKNMTDFKFDEMLSKKTNSK